jgi:FkbM family methyltransferase
MKDRYHVYEHAISDFDGEADFHMVEGDTGSASLNIFSDNLYETWPGRTDFVVRGSKKINVYRLDTWLKIFAPEITCIDHLHIDAQGSDLSVLRGLGKKLSMVQSGVVEVPQEDNLRLYKNQHTKQEALEFLEQNGFVIDKITSQVNEDNLYFVRKK